MPTWLAIAIPSVIAAAACIMWGVDYVKKAHEIEKLRLELEKLRLEAERSDRAEQSRASGLYKPTSQEVDRILTTHRRRGPVTKIDGPVLYSKGSRVWSSYVGMALIAGFFIYAAVRLGIDLRHLISFLLSRWLY